MTSLLGLLGVVRFDFQAPLANRSAAYHSAYVASNSVLHHARGVPLPACDRPAAHGARRDSGSDFPLAAKPDGSLILTATHREGSRERAATNWHAGREDDVIEFALIGTCSQVRGWAGQSCQLTSRRSPSWTLHSAMRPDGNSMTLRTLALTPVTRNGATLGQRRRTRSSLFRPITSIGKHHAQRMDPGGGLDPKPPPGVQVAFSEQPEQACKEGVRYLHLVADRPSGEQC